MAELPLFWQRALKQSTLLDIETGGLRPGKRVPISAATMAYGDVAATTAFFEPEVSVRVPSGRRAVRLRSEAQFLRRLEPFPRRMWEQHWQPERARHLAAGGRLQRPGAYFSQLAEKTADAGNILWAHNVHFDITGWASQHMSPQAMGTFTERAVVPPWYELDPRRGKIFPTLTSRAWKYRRQAREFPRTAAGQMRGFYGEFRTTVAEAVRTGKPMVADTMFVAQAMMGMAQGKGYMPATGDVFTGVGLESLHQAFFQRGYQAHLAAADVEAMGRLMPELIGTAEALYEGQPLRGRQAAALHRLGAMQPGIAEANVQRSFAEAQQQLRETGRYALRGERGAQVFSRDYADLLRIYEKRYGELAYRDFPSIRGIWERVGAMGGEEIAATLAERELPQLGRMARFGAAGAFAKAEIGHFLRTTNRTLLAGMAVAAGGALAYGLLPDREESNTIEGLREQGLAGYNRKLMTDFGSGFKRFAGQIHPDIREFREEVWGDTERRRAITADIKARQIAAQARLGRFEPDDFLAGDLGVVEGLDYTRGKHRAINLTKFRASAEDADTILLERRGFGNWLRARAGYGRIAVRLSGIDAPEVAGHRGDPLAAVRWRQEQPFGREATRILDDLMASRDVSLITGVDPESYGRYIGALVADGVNVNLELLRAGAAKALPWGDRDLLNKESAAAAEASAMSGREGIWGHSRYWRQRAVEGEIGQNITFNILTRMDVLASRSKMALAASAIEGYEPAIEGFQHRGIGSGMRRSMTDFGSGWRGLVSVPARWMASAGEASAEFLTKSGLAEHISNLKNELALAESIASMGAEMKGALNEVEMLELRQAIDKLGTMSGRKQGGILVATEELASRDPHRISRIKALISEERFHEAVANSKYMRDIIAKEGAVPMEWLMSMEAQSYGVAKDVRDGLRTMTEKEAAHVRFGWREEYFAKMSAMEVAGESMAIEDYLALNQFAGDRNFELLQRHAKRYRAGVIKQNARHYKHSQQIKAARMTTKTMERFAPLPLSGIRMFDSPGVPGMVQRIHGARKGSAKMYNH